MIVLFGLALSNQCSPTSTFQVTTLINVSHNEVSLNAENPPYCINITAPRVAISFHSLPDGFVRVYRRTSLSQEILQENLSSSPNKLFIIDFGSETGLLEFDSVHACELSYSLIPYPAECHSRITSSLRADIFQLDENCTHDGCLHPQSTICYFNSLWGPLQYSITADLAPDFAYLSAISESGTRKITGLYHSTISAPGTSGFMYFILRNIHPTDRLRSSVSVKVTGNHSVDRTGIRARSDSHEIAIFHENDIDSETLQIESRPAFFVLASVLFLCLALASAAYFLISQYQKEIPQPEHHRPLMGNRDDVSPMPVKERSAVLADGNPHEIPPV
jgi:hypothetical protein